MIDLIGSLGGSLVHAYQQKSFQDFLVEHFPVAGCLLGFLVVMAVILPIGPEWLRSTKLAGMSIMGGGLILMVGGFLWAGSISLIEAARAPSGKSKAIHPEVTNPAVRAERGLPPMPIIPDFKARQPSEGG